MLIYWLLLAFPAVMALAFPLRQERIVLGAGQVLAMAALVLFYGAVSLLRDEIGGDWFAYANMYDAARSSSVAQAVQITDPGFGLLLWIAAAFDLGIYPVNAICSLLLAYGTTRIAVQTREPWLALLIAIPYLWIVVGMGYVRQAAAIGLILSAAGSLGRGRSISTIVQLALALTFHSTSIVVWPLFAVALANRNKLRILVIATFGAAAFQSLLLARLTDFEAGYILDEYESRGAMVRLLMGLLPALLVLARWRAFETLPRVRILWLGFALANVAALVALLLLSASTAVDRVSLYFAAIQVIAFGNIAQLLGTTARTGLLVRLLVLAIAVAVQLVWMVYATHAGAWVPYKSILAYY
jgi:hypothetical protein